MGEELERTYWSPFMPIGLVILCLSAVFAVNAYSYYVQEIDDKTLSDDLSKVDVRANALFAVAGYPLLLLGFIVGSASMASGARKKMGYLPALFGAIVLIFWMLIGSGIYAVDIYADVEDTLQENIGDEFDTTTAQFITTSALPFYSTYNQIALVEQILFTGGEILVFLLLGLLMLRVGGATERGLVKLAGLLLAFSAMISAGGLYMNLKMVDWDDPGYADTSDYENYQYTIMGIWAMTALALLMTGLAMFQLPAIVSVGGDYGTLAPRAIPPIGATSEEGGFKAPPVAKSQSVKFCPECGESLPPGAPYCPYCGFKL